MKLHQLIISIVSISTLTYEISAERQPRNDVFDQVILDIVKQNRNELEPIQIPDHGSGFGVPFGRFNVTGEAKFHDIQLSGLSTLRRSGEAYVQKTRIGDYILSGKLAIGVLNINMSGSLNFLGVGPQKAFEGRIVHIDADLIVLYNAAERQFKLRKFEINELDGFTLRLKTRRMSLVNALSNRIMQRLLNSFERITKQTIEDAFSKILSRIMNKSNVLKTLIEREKQHEK